MPGRLPDEHRMTCTRKGAEHTSNGGRNRTAQLLLNTFRKNSNIKRKTLKLALQTHQVQALPPRPSPLSIRHVLPCRHAHNFAGPFCFQSQPLTPTHLQTTPAARPPVRRTLLVPRKPSIHVRQCPHNNTAATTPTPPRPRSKLTSTRAQCTTSAATATRMCR